MPDGNIPCCVFICSVDKSDESDIPVTALKPGEDFGLRDQSHSLFLVNEKGYPTIGFFEYIMKVFAKWWTTTRPGLCCYMIVDILSIHRNDNVVAEALRSGIYLLNVIPESSHWFQVHDQLPFGTLKNEMNRKKYELMQDTSLTAEQRKVLLMDRFYEAESVAFKRNVVKESFVKVGL